MNSSLNLGLGSTLRRILKQLELQEPLLIRRPPIPPLRPYPLASRRLNALSTPRLPVLALPLASNFIQY